MGRLGVVRRGAVLALLAAPLPAGVSAAAPSALEPGAHVEPNREVLSTGDAFEVRGSGVRGCADGLVDVYVHVAFGNNAVAAFLFVPALTDPAGASDGGSRTMLLRAGIVFGVFPAGSVAFWSWFRFRPDPDPPLAPPMDPRL